ncbi:hypothetical protein EVAR_75393_1 [Eumeta japonica]|uniref:Uncharacterized protein n=1 Tax=Eumeta variegata TaxID=151549 RepID=A0A4C1TMW7_EUMVA|nr:hypothetical protein EVAR_75393_1 [Eumeta japonica]
MQYAPEYHSIKSGYVHWAQCTSRYSPMVDIVDEDFDSNTSAIFQRLHEHIKWKFVIKRSQAVRAATMISSAGSVSRDRIGDVGAGDTQHASSRSP